METRELRYFVAVAEDLHFGRAAKPLGMAQPPLSRAIRQLERRLGAALLERTSRAVTLTEAGSVLLQEGRAALDAVEAAERRAHRAALAATGHAAVVLAAKAGASGELLAKLLDAYAAVQLCAESASRYDSADGRVRHREALRGVTGRSSPGRASHLVGRLEQLGDDGGADPSGRSGHEDPPGRPPVDSSAAECPSRPPAWLISTRPSSTSAVAPASFSGPL